MRDLLSYLNNSAWPGN